MPTDASADVDAFYSSAPTTWLAGSIGTVDIYPDNSASALQGESYATAESALITFIFEDMAKIYTAYDSALTTYNSDVDSYNVSVEAYNTALEAGDKEMPAVDEEPCAPSAPSAWDGFAMQWVEAWVPSSLAGDDDGVGAYDPTMLHTTLTTEYINDSFRMGSLFTQPDVTDKATAYAVANQAGHIFGRLGQGAWSMPDALAPFMFDDSDATYEPTI